MAPITLICYGKHREIAEKMSQGLEPEFTFTAVILDWKEGSEDSKHDLEVLIRALRPAPAAIVVGSAFNEVQQKEIEKVAQEHHLPFIGLTQDYLKEHGPEKTLQWCRDALRKEFGLDK